MRKWLVILTVLAVSSAKADPITGVEGFEYKAPPAGSVNNKKLASLKAGTNSQVSCDALGFTTNYGAVWDNVKNIADQVVSNKRTLLLGAAQYFLAKASPTLYSVLAKLNSMAELALKYNFDACALYKKAQAEAEKNATPGGLTALCMSTIGDPDVCSAPGRALRAVFGKDQVDVVDEVVKNKDTADLIKAVVGTVVLTANGSSLTTDYYNPAWSLGDLALGLYTLYYRKYAEIAEKVHNGQLNAEEYYRDYWPWITLGGEIDLSKVKVVNGWLDLSAAKKNTGGYQIPYEFFYEVAQFSPQAAAAYIKQLATYAAMIDLQALLSAIQKTLQQGAERSGKGGILAQEALIKQIQQDYEQFARTFGKPARDGILALQQSARERYAALMKNLTTTPANPVKGYMEALFEGPGAPK